MGVPGQEVANGAASVPRRGSRAAGRPAHAPLRGGETPATTARARGRLDGTVAIVTGGGRGLGPGLVTVTADPPVPASALGGAHRAGEQRHTQRCGDDDEPQGQRQPDAVGDRADQSRSGQEAHP